jgi:hypothetical protein
MNEQIIKWVKNDGAIKPKQCAQYLIKTNWRKVVAYWTKDEDGCFHWASTEGNFYSDTVVVEFSEI